MAVSRPPPATVYHPSPATSANTTPPDLEYSSSSESDSDDDGQIHNWSHLQCAQLTPRYVPRAAHPVRRVRFHTGPDGSMVHMPSAAMTRTVVPPNTYPLVSALVIRDESKKVSAYEAWKVEQLQEKVRSALATRTNSADLLQTPGASGSGTPPDGPLSTKANAVTAIPNHHSAYPTHKRANPNYRQLLKVPIGKGALSPAKAVRDHTTDVVTCTYNFPFTNFTRLDTPRLGEVKFFPHISQPEVVLTKPQWAAWHAQAEDHFQRCTPAIVERRLKRVKTCPYWHR